MSGMNKQAYVYILANKKKGVLYTGVTSDLVKRIWQHKQEIKEGFASKYRIHNLVWYETHGNISAAITREKQIKKWNRAWKIQLIEEANVDWRDLYADILP